MTSQQEIESLRESKQRETERAQELMWEIRQLQVELDIETDRLR